tara:strand:- start:7988 stop:8788 length:801 start_codon:yes stop_codon:yes gene_type:complete
MVKKIINKSPKVVQQALSNKYVLYAVLLFSVGHVIGYIQMGQWDALALYMAGVVVMSYFSKNMIINLLVAMFLGNCKVCLDVTSDVLSMFGVSNREGFVEGMKEGKDEKKIYELSDGKCNLNPKCTGEKCFSDDKCKNAIEKFKGSGQQRSAPAALDENDKDGDEDYAPGERLDYNATLEMAYNNLDKMLGKDGMKGLTAETQKLVGQQKNLMESLKTMAPVLESAKSTLDNMNLPDMEKMNSMMSKINGGGLAGLMPTGMKKDKK